MKKNLLIVLCPILLLLGLSLSNIAIAADDTLCTNATTATPAGYGGTCTDVGADLTAWLTANPTKECVAGKCLSAEHSDPKWKCCRTKPACTSPNTCVALTACNPADKISGTCPETTKPTCCKPLCEPANCRDKCDGTFEPDPSRSVNGCTDPAKKACCKPKGGTTDPSTGGGKTEGGTYPLAPLSPVGDINIPTLIGYIIKGVLGIVGSIALLMFVYGGFLMLISQGDAAKIKKGKDALVWAAAGLVVIFGSYIFVNYILTNLSKGGS